MEKKYAVPIFRLQYSQEFRHKFFDGCGRILDEGFLSNHTFVREFERKFAAWNNSRYAMAVSSGTAALEAIFRAIGIKGKEVIVPSNTFIATAAAVQSAGGIVKLVDVEEDSFSLGAKFLEGKISKNTAAIVTVHIGGLVSREMEKIAAIANSAGIPLVEDCAHAHGCSFRGTRAGNFGLAGGFSFFTTKVLTTGEGGMVVTNEDSFYEKLLSIRQFGREEANPLSHRLQGSNFKMTECQALLGILDLERSFPRIAKRRVIASIYQNKLRNTSWRAIEPDRDSFCTYYKQIILPPYPRESVKKHLEKCGISLTGGVYYIPLHQQPVLSADYSNHDFPVSNYFSGRHICPPCYPELELEEVEYICNKMLEMDGQ